MTYIAYKNNGVNFDLLSALNVGDSLNVLLKDGSGNSTYTIIYILKQGENLLFDVTEFYRNNDLIVSIIFTSIPLVASVILICLSISNVFGTVSKEEFKVYCEAKWTHTFFLIFFLLGFLVMVEIFVFYFAKLIPQANLGFVFVPLIFILIGGFLELLFIVDLIFRIRTELILLGIFLKHIISITENLIKLFVNYIYLKKFIF